MLDLSRAMDPIIYFGIAAVIAVILTAVVCRRRLACRKRVSYGTMVAGALGAGLVAFVIAFLYSDGADVFTLQFWRDPKQAPSLGAVLLGVVGTAVPCALAALGVVAYYQARQKNAKPQV